MTESAFHSRTAQPVESDHAAQRRGSRRKRMGAVSEGAFSGKVKEQTFASWFTPRPHISRWPSMQATAGFYGPMSGNREIGTLRVLTGRCRYERFRAGG